MTHNPFAEAIDQTENTLGDTNPFVSTTFLTLDEGIPGSRISGNPFESDAKLPPFPVHVILAPPTELPPTVHSLEQEITKTQQTLIAQFEKSALPPSVPMTSDVSLNVVGYEIFKNDYCVYHLEVTQYGVSQIVKKRFKELNEFHVLSGFPIDGPPKKAVKSSLKEQFIKERMADISNYFTRLERVKDAKRNPKFIIFFELEDLENKKKDAYFIQQSKMFQIMEELSNVKKERDLLKSEVMQLRQLKKKIF